MRQAFLAAGRSARLVLPSRVSRLKTTSELATRIALDLGPEFHVEFESKKHISELDPTRSGVPSVEQIGWRFQIGDKSFRQGSG